MANAAPYVAFVNEGDGLVWFIDANTVYGLFESLMGHMADQSQSESSERVEIIVKLSAVGYEIYIPSKTQGD